MQVLKIKHANQIKEVISLIKMSWWQKENITKIGLTSQKCKITSSSSLRTIPVAALRRLLYWPSLMGALNKVYLVPVNIHGLVEVFDLGHHIFKILLENRDGFVQSPR